MKEKNVYTLVIFLCIACFAVALKNLNIFAMVGFGLAIIGNFSASGFSFVGIEQDDQSKQIQFCNPEGKDDENH
ncbi:hypothetical protein IB292_03275 [Vibrio parahaemolyticus]|uniref:Uncharacterized protein n=1 Tax=Vibrio parahaemolyticus TaxID=670 RepID=A0A9Q3U833_VIBPH|nr:hypothetical protein [Vibrio parahaemolyticus]MCC3804054.1 hypothetical protein [Vibrio parahaemolyticus]